MTVQQLLAAASSKELAEWQAYFQTKKDYEAGRNVEADLEAQAVRGLAELKRKKKGR